MHHRRRPILILQLLAAWLLFTAGTRPALADEEFLDPEVAFKLEARALDERSVEVVYTIAPGYYLYRDKLLFTASGATLGAPVLPPGKTKFDETFQKTVETYRDTVRIAVLVQRAAGPFQLLATNQGCADRGLCYPPQQRGIAVALAGFGGDGSARVMRAGEKLANAGAAGAAVTLPAGTDRATDIAGIEGALHGGRFLSVVGVFFVAGLLLSLTPCVLPMLPILSSIIVGQGAQVSRGRGFSLALSYSLGMALVYTALGIAAGLTGEGLAAALQTPWVLAFFAMGLVALSLSMFGLYELPLPAGITGRLSNASRRLPAGRFAGVFAMGGISALIVSPCVAAPLAGALVYLSQTRDVWLGGTALFSLAAGMSAPLLLVGASAGALLPRAGGWMDDVKRFFGIVLLAVALWTVQSVLSAPLVLALWGVLAIGVAVLLLARHDGRRPRRSSHVGRRAAAAVFGICSLLEFVGAASGGSNPLQPLARLRGEPAADDAAAPVFTAVRSVADLDAALRNAGRPVMLDFYADWCVSCKEMERFTFVDRAVREKMRSAVLLRADVTANNDDDRALLKRFQLFGPPGTIFFDRTGRELTGARLAGFQDSAGFVQTLHAAGL